MIITLDLFWTGADLKPDEKTEWLGGEEERDDEAGATIDRAYADMVGQQMEEDFGHLLRMNEALEFCGRLSLEYARPHPQSPFLFQIALDLNLQGQPHRGLFLLPATALDDLAERIGHPGYHMLGNVRLALSLLPDVKAPYRRTRSRHITVEWNKGKSEDVRLHFPVLFPFDEPLSPAIVYTSWMDFSSALSLLIERRKRLRMA